MKALTTLSRSFLERHPAEAARVLEQLPDKALARYMARLPPESTAPVLTELDAEAAAGCLRNMTPGTAAAIAQRLDDRVRVAALRRMPERSRERICAAFDEGIAEHTRRLLAVASGSVAAVMDTAAVTLTEDMRVSDAVQRIRRTRTELDGEIFVLNHDRHPVGTTSVHALTKGPRDEPVSSRSRPLVTSVPGNAPQSMLLEPGLWAAHNSVAVVDEDGVFLGVVDHRRVAGLLESLTLDRKGSDGLETLLALGELYWMGLSGMLDGLARGRDAENPHGGPPHGRGAED